MKSDRLSKNSNKCMQTCAYKFEIITKLHTISRLKMEKKHKQNLHLECM